MSALPLPFFEHGQERLEALAGTRLLCAFDFDGTLAPIVTQPEHARTPLPVLQRLIELQSHVPIAVITGRSIADIRDKLGFEPDYLVGNHGQEGVPGMTAHAVRHAGQCAQWKSALQRMLAEPAFDPNIWIEDKTYSLSLHYRLARDQQSAEAALREALARLTPVPRIVGGKCVFNVLPEDAFDKGRALVALMQVCDAPHALYVGDDVTDEDVFRLARPDILSLRIGRSGESAARFYLNHRLDLLQVLDRLVRRLRETGAMNWLPRGTVQTGT